MVTAITPQTVPTTPNDDVRYWDVSRVPAATSWSPGRPKTKYGRVPKGHLPDRNARAKKRMLNRLRGVW